MTLFFQSNAGSLTPSGTVRKLIAKLLSGVGGGFNVVNFDGTDYLGKGAALTGASNGKEFSFSTKFTKLTDGTAQSFVVGRKIGQARLYVQLEASGRIRIYLRNSTPSVIFTWLSAFGEKVLVASGEVEILVSVNLLTGVHAVYINGTLSTGSASTNTNDNIDYAGCDNWGVAADNAGNSPLFGDVSYIWMTDEYIDLSVSANRTVFADPTTMLSDGSGPTGTVPLTYYTGVASVWNAGTNQGSGGNHTMNNAVTDVGGGGGAGASVTPTGDLVAQSIFAQIVSGVITPSGAVSKVILKALSGASTPSSSLSKLTQKVLDGSLTPTGTVLASVVILVQLTGQVIASGILAPLLIVGGIAKRKLAGLMAALKIGF